MKNIHFVVMFSIAAPMSANATAYVRDEVHSINYRIGISDIIDGLSITPIEPIFSTFVSAPTEVSMSSIDYSYSNIVNSDNILVTVTAISSHSFEPRAIKSGHEYITRATLEFHGPIAYIKNDTNSSVRISVSAKPDPLRRRARFVWIENNFFVDFDNPALGGFGVRQNNFSWSRQRYHIELPANEAATVFSRARIETRFGSFIPEPSTWAMLIAGFGLVGWKVRRANQPAQRLSPTSM